MAPRRYGTVIAQDIAVGLTALASTGSPGGGWGWRPGAHANTECTALAVLAFHAWQETYPGMRGVLRQGIRWLEFRQLGDGSWPTGDEVPGSSWMTSLASFAMTHATSGSGQAAVRGGRWLLRSRSRGATLLQRIRTALSSEEPLVDQDQTIPGWSWTSETTAWVEPTSWALLALKQLDGSLPERATRDRIDQGHALLEDRMCRGGGWNYGNKAVLGADLPPYPDTTALALLALQDHRSPEITEPSLARMASMLRENRSALALALSILALQLYDRNVAPERTELRRRLPALAAAAEVRTLSLALLALQEQDMPFRIPLHA